MAPVLYHRLNQLRFARHLRRKLAGLLPGAQPSRFAPSLPHQVPKEHAENTGTRKRRHPKRPPALDPLENSVRKWRSSVARQTGQPLRAARLTL